MDSAIVLNACEAFNRRAALKGWPVACDATLTFERAELSAALACWREKAEGRLPARADFTARALMPFLRNIAFADIVHRESGDLRFRIRLAGTALTPVYGELTGTFADEQIPLPYRERWIACLEEATRAKAPLRFTARVDFAGEDYLNTELLVAPLAADGKTPDMLFAVIYFDLAGRHMPSSNSALTRA